MLGSGISARRKQAVMSRLAGLLRRLLFGLPAASLDTRSTPSGPTAGQVYTFETLPVYETSPAETARFAALKIIGVVRGCVILAVLNKTGATPPALFQARRGNVLIKNAFEWGGCPAVFGVPLASWTPERGNLPADRAVSQSELQPRLQRSGVTRCIASGFGRGRI